jgi:hypothetical protein
MLWEPCSTPRIHQVPPPPAPLQEAKFSANRIVFDVPSWKVLAKLAWPSQRVAPLA